MLQREIIEDIFIPPEEQTRHNVMLWLDAEVRDKEGNLYKRIHRPSESFTQNFLKLLQIQMNQVAQTISSTTATPTINPSTADFWVVGATSGQDLFGIRVGSSNQSPVTGNITLVAKISNGNTSPAIAYGTQTLVLVLNTSGSGAGSTASITCQRQFTNNDSVASITVREIDMCSGAEGFSSQAIEMIRDTVSDTVVAPGQTLTVTYVLQTAV